MAALESPAGSAPQISEKENRNGKNDNGTPGRYLEMGWQHSGHLQWLALVG